MHSTLQGKSMGGEKHRVEWLASLRGLMVFLVFFSHQTELGINRDIMFTLGRIGVVGFFLMSGYLAVDSLARRNIRQFALNRFLRIYPIFWLLVTMRFLLIYPERSVSDLLFNMTLFNEFFSVDKIIGASWMLPIMVVFFIVLMVCKRNATKLADIAFWAICVGALLLGVLRMITDKPFPTAFFLLQLVGLLGWIYKTNENDANCSNPINKKFTFKLIAFELVLVAASYMSYDIKVVWYFIAYNIGFLTLWLFERYNICNIFMQKLGALGFTFFLGAGIPILVLSKFVDITDLNVYAEVALKFVLAIALAWIVTKYIERPLLNKGKKWEKEIMA